MKSPCTPALLKIQTDLDFIRYYLTLRNEDQAGLPTTDDASGVDRRWPEGAHYRELAHKLRGLACDCCFPNPQQELLSLARRYERRADHLDGRAARK